MKETTKYMIRCDKCGELLLPVFTGATSGFFLHALNGEKHRAIWRGSNQFDNKQEAPDET